MDPNYAAVASDINRLLPKEYECINVTPVRQYRTWDEEGHAILGEGYTPVHNTSIAEKVGVQVVVKDEYRESWWNEIGGQPQITSTYPLELFDEIAGVGDLIAPDLATMLEAFIDIHRPKPKTTTGAKKKSTTKK